MTLWYKWCLCCAKFFKLNPIERAVIVIALFVWGECGAILILRMLYG